MLELRAAHDRHDHELTTTPGLPPTTSYSYRVRATDAAGNLSGYSSVGTATTLSGTGYDGTECADEPGGGRDHDQCDQSELDRLDG